MTTRLLTIGALGFVLLNGACTGGTQDHARIEVRSADCIVCHASDVQQALNPPHEGFPDTCGTCHSNDAWMPAAFMHSWPLNGAHEAIDPLRRLPPKRLRQQPLPGTRHVPHHVSGLSHDQCVDAGRGRDSSGECIPDSGRAALEVPQRTACPVTIRSSDHQLVGRTPIVSGVTTTSTRERRWTQSTMKSPTIRKVPRPPTSAWTVTPTAETKPLRTS